MRIPPLLVAVAVLSAGCTTETLESANSQADGSSQDLHDIQVGWKNLPPSGRFSIGHIEIPSRRFSPSRDANMLTLIFTDNWVQGPDGEMQYINVHRYAEVFVVPAENLQSAAFTGWDAQGEVTETFEPSIDYRSFFFEGGYYPTLDALQAEVPSSRYAFELTTDDGREIRADLDHPEGATPGPTIVSLFQNGVQVAHNAVDPEVPLHIRWTGYEGQSDPNRILDDIITIALDDCANGNRRIWVSGEPTLNGTYLTYEADEVVVPVGIIQPGQSYFVEGEFSDVVATDMAAGIPVQTAFVNSVLFGIGAIGGTGEPACSWSMPQFDEAGNRIEN